MATCPACRKTIPGGQPYCAYCGTRTPSWPARLRERYRWPFLGRWLLVSLVAATLSWLAIGELFRRGFNWGLYPLGALTLAALLIGAGQWLVLRTRARRALWWAIGLPAGWALAFFLYAIWPRLAELHPGLEPFARSLLAAGVIGAVAALCQWPVARRYVWPAWLWIAAAAGTFALTVSVAALSPAAQPYGWLGVHALGLPGREIIATSDMGLAALLGALLGAGQFPLARRSAPGTLLWPLVLAASGAATAVVFDVGLATFAELSQAAGWTSLASVQAVLVNTPLGGILAWLALGTGLGAGQALVLRWSPALVARLPRVTPAVATEASERGWLPLTTAGYVVAWPIAWQLLPYAWLLLGAAAAGLLAGLPQWLALRGDYPTAAWLPATNAGAYALFALLTRMPGAPGTFELAGLLALISLLSLAPGLALARR